MTVIPQTLHQRASYPPVAGTHLNSDIDIDIDIDIDMDMDMDMDIDIDIDLFIHIFIYLYMYIFIIIHLSISVSLCLKERKTPNPQTLPLSKGAPGRSGKKHFGRLSAKHRAAPHVVDVDLASALKP